MVQINESIIDHWSKVGDVILPEIGRLPQNKPEVYTSQIIEGIPMISMCD